MSKKRHFETKNDIPKWEIKKQLKALKKSREKKWGKKWEKKWLFCGVEKMVIWEVKKKMVKWFE